MLIKVKDVIALTKKNMIKVLVYEIANEIRK